MTNKEAREEIRSMGLIIDAATSGTRRKSIYEALTLAIKALEDVKLNVDVQITFDEYVRRCNLTQSDGCAYDE